MCEGIRQLIEQGKSEGRSEGISIGKNEGRNDKIKELITKKLSKGKSIPTIADELEESVEVIEHFIAAM